MFQFASTAKAAQLTPAEAPVAGGSTFNFSASQTGFSNPFQNPSQTQSPPSFGGNFAASNLFGQSAPAQKPSVSFDFGTTNTSFNAPRPASPQPGADTIGTQQAPSLFTLNTMASPGPSSSTHSRPGSRGSVRSRTNRESGLAKSPVKFIPLKPSGLPVEWNEDPAWLASVGDAKKEETYASKHHYVRISEQQLLATPPTVAQGAKYISIYKAEAAWAAGGPSATDQSTNDPAQQPQAFTKANGNLFGTQFSNPFGLFTGTNANPFMNASSSTSSAQTSSASPEQNPFAKFTNANPSSTNFTTPSQAPSTSMFTTSSTPATTKPASSAQNQSTNLFANGQKPTSTLFGNTETPKPQSNLFGTAQTPSGASNPFGAFTPQASKGQEPESNTEANTTKPLFNFGAQSSGTPSNIFPSAQTPKKASSNMSGSAQTPSSGTGLFTSTEIKPPSFNLFGNPQGRTANAKAQPTEIHPSSPTTEGKIEAVPLPPASTQGNIFGDAQTPLSKGNLFGKPPTSPQDTTMISPPQSEAAEAQNDSIDARLAQATGQTGREQPPSLFGSIAQPEPNSNAGKTLFDRISRPDSQAGSQPSAGQPKFNFGTPSARSQSSSAFSDPSSQPSAAGASKVSEPKPQIPASTIPMKPSTPYGMDQMVSKVSSVSVPTQESQEYAASVSQQEPSPPQQEPSPSQKKPAAPSAPLAPLPESYTRHLDALQSGELSQARIVEILLHDWLVTILPPEEALDECNDQPGLIWQWRHRELQREWKLYIDTFGPMDRHMLETFRVVQSLQIALDTYSGKQNDRNKLWIDAKYFDEILIKKNAKENLEKWAKRSATQGESDPDPSKKRKLDDQEKEEPLGKKQKYHDVSYPALPETSSRTAHLFASVANAASSSSKPESTSNHSSSPFNAAPAAQTAKQAESPVKTSKLFANAPVADATNPFSNGPKQPTTNLFANPPKQPSTNLFTNPPKPLSNNLLTDRPEQLSTNLFASSSKQPSSNLLFGATPSKASSEKFQLFSGASPAKSGPLCAQPFTDPIERPQKEEFKVPSFGSSTGSDSTSQSTKTAEQTQNKEKSKRKAGDFGSDEDNKEQWEKKDQEEQRAKRARLEEATSKKPFGVPTFGSSAATDFTAQFGQNAKMDEDKEKAKRKAEDFDSEDDDEAEWEKKYEEEKRAKRAKIEEAASKSKGFEFKPSGDSATAKPSSSVPQFGASTGHDFTAQFGRAATKTAQDAKRKRMEEDYDSEEETKEQWEARYAKEQQAKKAKIEEAAKSGTQFRFQSTPATPDPKSQGSQTAGFGKEPAAEAVPRSTTPPTEKKPEQSTSLFGDHTWKPDTPIKFGGSSAAPAVSITAPSPLNPNKGLGESVLGSENAGKPAPRSIFDTSSISSAPSIFTQGASPKPDSPSNAPAPSIFDQVKPATATFDFTKPTAASGPSPPATDGWKDFLSGKNKPASPFTAAGLQAASGSPAPSFFGSLTPSRAVSPAISAATHSGAETDTGAEDAAGGGEDGSFPKDPQLNLASANAGEEEEDLLFTVKAKVLEFTTLREGEEKKWHIRGVGELRVLRSKETRSTRVVVRQEASARVLLNAGLLGGVSYGLASGKSVNFTVAGSDGSLGRWLIQVGKKEDAEELSGMLEENKGN